MTFRQARLEELPSHLDGPEGRAFAGALGDAQDEEQELLTVGVLQRYPPRTPDDALDLLGHDSGIERFPGEAAGTAVPPTGYRGRLVGRWRTWKQAGSKQAIIDSLNEWGVPDVAVDNDYEVTPPWPGSWSSRFRVRLGPAFGAFGWGVGNDPTADQQGQIQRQVLKWKWVFSYPVDVVLDYGGGNSFTFYIGPIIGFGFVIGKSTIGGYAPL